MGSYRGISGGRPATTTGMRTLTWFVIMAAVAAVGLALSLSGTVRPLQSATQRLTEPITSLVYGVTAPLADFVANAGRYGRLRQENRDLRLENEQLRVELAQAREEDIRARELADLLQVGTQVGGGQLSYASIIARDPSSLRDLIAINRGTQDGVQDGMTVLGKGGALVGTVERALDSVAWVRLITDPQSSVNVVIQESRARALASGTADRGVRTEFLPQGVMVRPGDTVMTSGLGGTYPAGLLVGRVARVEGGPVDVFKRVQIEPAVQLSSVESVAVMTGFRPTPVEGLGR